MDALTNNWGWIVRRVVLPLAGLYLAPFLYTWVKIRLLFYRLNKQGLPMPPWNPVFGNLPAIASVTKKVPRDAQAAMTFSMLAADSGLDTCFYIDTWPFGFSILIVTSHDIAIQACQTHDLPKPAVISPLIDPMAGGPTVFTTNGSEQKRGRELFHHGFSMRSVFGYMPFILQEVEVYVDVLRDLAKTGETFRMDEITCRYMMDVIGNVTMQVTIPPSDCIITDHHPRNTRFISQRRYHPIASAMRDTINWECQIEAGNYFTRMNPIRPFKQWRNSRTMNHYIGIELEKRYQEWKHQDYSDSSGPKTLMDLAIEEHMKAHPVAAPTLDPTFKAWATAHIRLFLFVGHDSTAVTIAYAHYLLSKHPAILANVRAEHDQVFGTDLTKTASQLRDSPEQINQLPYTSAVIKETFRLYPPANGIRQGSRDVILRDPKTGMEYPTEGCAIWTLHLAIHRNAQHWPDPHAFIPERWLVDPDHPLYPPAGAWRPFEHGPRDCIGQALALVDIRATLLMTVREFDFVDQYAEWDSLNPGHGLNTMFGERAYMVQAGSGRPAQGMPCKVALTARSPCK
ncbi:cytochrome P450 [Aspergillus crustosus]